MLTAREEKRDDTGKMGNVTNGYEQNMATEPVEDATSSQTPVSVRPTRATPYC